MAVEIGKREGELQRMSMVIEQSPESIVITDTSGSILYVNQAFQRITGYARATRRSDAIRASSTAG